MSILSIFDFKPKLKHYADELIKALAQEGHADWKFDQEQQALIHESGSIMHLVNFHAQYAAARRTDRAGLIDHCVAMCLSLQLQPPKEWSEAADGVRLVVRSRYDMAAMEANPGGHESNYRPTVSWPFDGDLQLRLVFDFGPHVSHVAVEDMQAWAKPESVVKAQAMENLAALDMPEWKELSAGVFQIDPDAEFADSNLLLDSVMGRLPFDDRVAVVLPNRGVLLAADSSSDAAMTTMLNEAIRCLQSKPWPMSGTAYIREGSHWKRFERDGEIGKLLHVLNTLNMAGIYEHQKEAIDSHNESIGRDVYVATFSVVERDGGLSSWSSWAQDCITLLPVTDIVVLGRNNGQADPSEHVAVAWNDLKQAVGNRMRSSHLSPERFLVDSFPDAAQWNELAKRQLEL